MVAVMYSPGTLYMLAVCDGPDVSGHCPQVRPGEPVPCAGLDLVLSKETAGAEGPVRIHEHVPVHATACPVAVALAHQGYFSPYATV